MTTTRDQDIASVIDAVRNGSSQAEAARQFDVPPSTLSERLHGATSKGESKPSACRLSPMQEKLLFDWILNEEGAGGAPSKAEMTRIAQEILAQDGVFKLLGHRWVDRFIARHDPVKTKQRYLLEVARKRGSTKAAYEDFFERLCHQITTKNIGPLHITNMDEHGIQELETNTGTVIGDSLTSKSLIVSSEPSNWVFVIEAVRTEGVRLTPCDRLHRCLAPRPIAPKVVEEG